jgi:hypothetical protein
MSATRLLRSFPACAAGRAARGPRCPSRGLRLARARRARGPQSRPDHCRSCLRPSSAFQTGRTGHRGNPCSRTSCRWMKTNVLMIGNAMPGRTDAPRGSGLTKVARRWRRATNGARVKARGTRCASGLAHGASVGHVAWVACRAVFAATVAGRQRVGDMERQKIGCGGTQGTASP